MVILRGQRVETIAEKKKTHTNQQKTIKQKAKLCSNRKFILAFLKIILQGLFKELGGTLLTIIISQKNTYLIIKKDLPILAIEVRIHIYIYLQKQAHQVNERSETCWKLEKLRYYFCFHESPNSKFKTQNSKLFLKYKLSKKIATRGIHQLCIYSATEKDRFSLQIYT